MATHNPMIAHIVAVSENNIIGSQGHLPWDIPEDMKFFRDKTKGHALIMGRKTFESLGSPLPHRLNVVVTRQENYPSSPGVAVTASLEEAIKICQEHTQAHKNEIFIIGGGDIYKQSLSLVNRIYLTRIHQSFEGDTKYPSIPEEFQEIERRSRTEPVPFSFLIYDRDRSSEG